MRGVLAPLFGIEGCHLRIELYRYDERLKEHGLTTQATRRLGGGAQIEVLTVLNGYDNIDSNIYRPIV